MNQLQAEIESICADEGTHLIELDLRGDKRRPVVDVYVDSEAGVDLETCGKISRRIDTVLELKKGFSTQYRLNVSSPGVERPLTFFWQLRKHIGRTVILTRANGEKVRAVLEDVLEDDRLSLQVAGRKKAGGSKEVANLKEAEIVPQSEFQSAIVEIAW